MEGHRLPIPEGHEPRSSRPGHDQYDLTRTIVPIIEAYAVRSFPNKTVRAIAAGHSLGGGLAQQAGYASSGIKLVYAFDSSSVTGFYDVDEAARDKAKVGMRVYRLGERGEVLQYFRGFMSLNASPNVPR